MKLLNRSFVPPSPKNVQMKDLSQMGFWETFWMQMGQQWSNIISMIISIEFGIRPLWNDHSTTCCLLLPHGVILCWSAFSDQISVWNPLPRILGLVINHKKIPNLNAWFSGECQSKILRFWGRCRRFADLHIYKDYWIVDSTVVVSERLLFEWAVGGVAGWSQIRTAAPGTGLYCGVYQICAARAVVSYKGMPSSGF